MSRNVPAYYRQKETGRPDRAYVRIDGRKINLGVYDSPESRKRYAEELAQSKGPETDSLAGSESPTVAVVMAAYLEHVNTYYGKPSPMRYHILGLMRSLKTMFGLLPADQFKALRLQELRDYWVALGWSRSYVNAQVNRLRRMFKWAVARELITPEVHRSLRSVDNLRRGHCAAPDKPPVAPVPLRDLAKTLRHLPERVAVMVRVQRLCGCRPGELIRITKGDIDRSGDIWTVDLKKHKTASKGKRRLICFGPRAQRLILPLLVCADDDRLFAMRRDSYRQAVHRACARAGVPNWSPNQLRHLAATRVRELIGLEAAQVHLGHARADVTQVYAETSKQKTVEVARRIG